MEQRVYQGHVYTRNSPSEPWTLAGPVPQQRGTIIADPTAPRDEARKDTALDLDQARFGLSQQQMQLQLAAQQRAAEEDRRKIAALDARGGVETTEAERTAAFLATRVANGVNQLGAISGSNSAPGLYEGKTAGTTLGNYTVSDERTRIANAQLDILDAALTLGTGAAYTREQLEGYRQSYFPQPGEKAGAVADKQNRLRTLLEAARVKAGAAAPQIDAALANSGVFAAPPEQKPPAKDPYADLAVPNQLTTDENVTQNTPPQNTPPQDYSGSVLSQGMSGVNEGIGNTLGAPVDIMTAALNLVPQGINKIANTNIPTIQDPMLGSDWWKQNVLSGTINPETADPTNQFVRRVGQSVGGAAIPVAGTATTPMRAIAGLLASGGGGVGAATAREIAPGNPYAEMAGDVAGALLTGGGAGQLAARTARKGAEAAVPSIADLKNQASNLYSQAESRGIVAGPNVTGNLSGKVRQIAQDEALITPTGRVSGDYPRAAEAMKLLDDYSGKDMSVKDIQVVRDTLSDAVQATEGKERRIARQMLDAFDAETTPLAPELSAARKTASKYLSAGQIQKAIDLAEPAAAQFSLSGKANALKTQFRGLDRNIIKGNEQFDPAVVEAINKVSRGTPGTQALTQVGKLAPVGALQGPVAAGVPFMMGTALGGPQVGAAASGATMTLGSIAKLLADKSVARNADVAEILARNGGPLQVPGVVDDELMRQIAAQLSAEASPYATPR